ncbi:thioredoxin-2-like isoform X2 [Pyxicephalus adspersus]|uniref:thioredoxin-2-like isoform X2 n=1 Tax=Pyxicephalus adspersus TaxID=30357 RepID=UPI003B5A127A
MAVTHVKDMEELNRHIKCPGNHLLVVTFSSPNCGPCRPVPGCLAALCEEMPDIKFVKVDVGKNDEFTKHFKLKGVPAFFFFRNGDCYQFEGGNMGFFRKTVEEWRFKTHCS